MSTATENSTNTANGTTPTTPVRDTIRFKDGVTAKGKLIGIEDVKEETGDNICNTSMVKLKAVVLAKKEHKLPIFIKISYEGVHIIDAKTNEILHHHPVERISYIARDPNDARAFGYIFRNANYDLQYIAIKTERQSSEVVLQLKDLFEDVYEQKKTKKEQAKKEANNSTSENQNPIISNTNETPSQVGNMFDLEESAPPQITLSQANTQQPTNQVIDSFDNQFQQSPNTNQNEMLANQISTSPPLVPTSTGPQNNDILSFFDTPSTQTSPVAKAPSNSELLSLSVTPDFDKFLLSKPANDTANQPNYNINLAASLPNNFTPRQAPTVPPLQHQQSFPNMQTGFGSSNPFGLQTTTNYSQPNVSTMNSPMQQNFQSFPTTTMAQNNYQQPPYQQQPFQQQQQQQQPFQQQPFQQQQQQQFQW